MTPAHLELALDVARLLDELEVPYVVGGSVASSLIGEPRSTVDVDFAVRMDVPELETMLDRVRATFYVPEGDAVRAVREKDSFNIIHSTQALKVDLFVLGDGVLDQNQLSRRVRISLPTDPAGELWVTSPEDQILRKLDWYRQGGGVSDRQMRDVVAILEINDAMLDHDYLRETADQVGLGELLAQAEKAAR